MGIFPVISEVVTTESNENKITYNPLFDFKTKQMVIRDGKVVLATRKEKIKQWIELLIRTEVGKYLVYEGSDFGLTDLYSLQGHQLFTSNYGISQMKEDIKRSIEAKDEVVAVQNINITSDFNKLRIEIEVITDEETIVSEVNI